MRQMAGWLGPRARPHLRLAELAHDPEDAPFNPIFAQM